MIYEELGEWSDAMIAYRKAYEAYKKYQENFSVAMPGMLKLDLIRLARREGLTDELAKYQEEFGITPNANKSPAAGPEGELVFILNNGLAPIKREHVISTWVPSPATDKHPKRAAQQKPGAQAKPETPAPPIMVNIALPYYESRPNRIAKARISVSGKQAETQLMENIDAIARTSLTSRMPAITARAVARAIAKGAIQQSVDKAGQDNDNAAAAKLIGSLLIRVAAVATERADTRSWLTLPANVQLARLSLPPGTYDVTVDLLGTNDQVISSRVFPQISIRKEHNTYLTQHSMP
jgi:hypothetical protein